MMQPKYLPGALVYLKTDIDCLPRLVTAYKVTMHDITYELSCETRVSYHYDFEITPDKNYLQSTKAAGFNKQQ